MLAQPNNIPTMGFVLAAKHFFAKILAGTIVMIQITRAYQIFGHALVLVVPEFWLG